MKKTRVKNLEAGVHNCFGRAAFPALGFPFFTRCFSTYEYTLELIYERTTYTHWGIT